MIEPFPSPVLAVAVDALRELEGRDTLSSLCTLFSKCKGSLHDGRRLENISWRLWYRQMAAPSSGSSPTSSSEIASPALSEDRSTSPFFNPSKQESLIPTAYRSPSSSLSCYYSNKTSSPNNRSPMIPLTDSSSSALSLSFSRPNANTSTHPMACIGKIIYDILLIHLPSSKPCPSQAIPPSQRTRRYLPAPAPAPESNTVQLQPTFLPTPSAEHIDISIHPSSIPTSTSTLTPAFPRVVVVNPTPHPTPPATPIMPPVTSQYISTALPQPSPTHLSPPLPLLALSHPSPQHKEPPIVTNPIQPPQTPPPLRHKSPDPDETLKPSDARAFLQHSPKTTDDPSICPHLSSSPLSISPDLHSIQEGPNCAAPAPAHCPTMSTAAASDMDADASASDRSRRNQSHTRSASRSSSRGDSYHQHARKASAGGGVSGRRWKGKEVAKHGYGHGLGVHVYGRAVARGVQVARRRSSGGDRTREGERERVEGAGGDGKEGKTRPTFNIGSNSSNGDGSRSKSGGSGSPGSAGREVVGGGAGGLTMMMRASQAVGHVPERVVERAVVQEKEKETERKKEKAKLVVEEEVMIIPGKVPPKPTTKNAAAVAAVAVQPPKRRIVVASTSSESEYETETDSDEDGDDSWEEEESVGAEGAGKGKGRTGDAGAAMSTAATSVAHVGKDTHHAHQTYAQAYAKSSRQAQRIKDEETQLRLHEAALEAQRQREMFAKVPKRSYSNLNRTGSGLLSQLLNPDPTIFPVNHPYRRGYSNQDFSEATRRGLQGARSGGPSGISAARVAPGPLPPGVGVGAGPLQTSKSAAALPVAAQVTVAQNMDERDWASSRVGNGRGPYPTTTVTNATAQGMNGSGGGGYRPKGRPQGLEMDEDSESEEDNPEDTIQVSMSIAQQKLAALAGRRTVAPMAPPPVPTAAPPPAGHRHPRILPLTTTIPTTAVVPRSPPIPTPAPALIPLGHPYNLPPPEAPSTPRTTRRLMLQKEMSESLRRNLLWERQMSKIGPRRGSSGALVGAAAPRPPLTSTPSMVQLSAKTGSGGAGERRGGSAGGENEKEESKRRAMARNRSWADDYHYRGW